MNSRASSVSGRDSSAQFSTRFHVRPEELSGATTDSVPRRYPFRESIVFVELQVHEELSNSILFVSGLRFGHGFGDIVGSG
jgi:hypothetical protein